MIDSWNDNKVLSVYQKKLRKILIYAAIRVRNEAKLLCPVDTSNLQKSIDYLVDGYKRAIVGTNVEYAPHVEYGTKKWKGKPYLRPALDALTPSIMKRIIRLVR